MNIGAKPAAKFFMAGTTFVSLGFLSACQVEKVAPPLPSGPANSFNLQSTKAPTPLVVSVARAAQNCWFSSKDPAFSKYVLANETNSHSGHPRFLLVPKNRPSGLPLLVVEAAKNGKNAQLKTYGKLLNSQEGQRISRDINRWSTGNSACKT